MGSCFHQRSSTLASSLLFYLFPEEVASGRKLVCENLNIHSRWVGQSASALLTFEPTFVGQKKYSAYGNVCAWGWHLWLREREVVTLFVSLLAQLWKFLQCCIHCMSRIERGIAWLLNSSCISPLHASLIFRPLIFTNFYKSAWVKQTVWTLWYS